MSRLKNNHDNEFEVREIENRKVLEPSTRL